MEASEKQIKFMNNLGIKYPANITIDEAKVLISMKLAECEQTAPIKEWAVKTPVEVVKPQEYKFKHMKQEDIAEKDIITDFEPTSMYVSYAKDIFNEMFDIFRKEKPSMTATDCMELAINLVKQAHEAFS